MPCLVVLLALIAPRVVSVVLYFFTNVFDRAFTGRFGLWIIGVLLMPFTTLAYAWAVNAEGGVQSSFFIVVMILAVIADLSSMAGGRYSRR